MVANAEYPGTDTSDLAPEGGRARKNGKPFSLVTMVDYEMREADEDFDDEEFMEVGVPSKHETSSHRTSGESRTSEETVGRFAANTEKRSSTKSPDAMPDYGLDDLPPLSMMQKVIMVLAFIGFILATLYILNSRGVISIF